MKYQEIWKIIENSSDYDVSNFGNVKSRKSGKILKPRWTSWGGYFMVAIWNDDGVREDRLIHHLVLEAFVGECPHAYEAHHRDGNKANNYLFNLKWIPHYENIGLSYGKLTMNKVREIRRKHVEGKSSKDLAEEFNVSYRNIRFVVTNRTWREGA
jgi:hypothetical protein